MTARSDKLRIIVCGMVGNHPLGGVAWDYFHYVLGLAELGHDVYYHEDTWCWPNDPILGYATDDPTYSANFIRSFFETHAPHLKDRWHYFHLHDSHHGMSAEAFDAVAKTADVFLNVSGASFFPDVLNPRAVKVFMDTDPGYNQIVLATRPAWSQNVERWIAQVRQHDRHLTYAENIWADDCLLPRLDIDWRPTRCVVTAEPWDAAPPPKPGRPLTTVMSWNYFAGPLVYEGVQYDAKAAEFEKFFDLPKRTNVPLVVAVGGHKQPADRIKENGWVQADAKELSLTPQRYVEFIADSLGEWSIAKNCFVAPRTGWFSCRTACYLAAGRPAVVQETGWSKYVPSGEGVIAFSTMEETLTAIDHIASDPAKHSRAAREIAREYLAPDRVLPPMIDTIFASKRDERHLPPSKSPPPGPLPEYQEGDKR
jgi:hypothetical protein